MSKISDVGGSPGGEALRDFLTVGHNDDGTLKGGPSDVTSIQGRPVAATAPTDTQVLAWDQAGNTWKPAAAVAGLATSATDLTFSAGTGAVSGDLIFQTNNVEVGRFTFGGRMQFGAAQGIRSNETSIVYSGKSGFTPSGIVQYNMFSAEAFAKGVSPAGPTSRMHGFSASIKDDPKVDKWTITGAANNGSGLIRLTVTSTGTVNSVAMGTGIVTGDPIGVASVGGTTEANGQWVATVVDATHIDLQGSTFTNAYTSGGTVTNRGAYYCFNALVWPTVDRGGLGAGTAANGDDVACYTAYNRGTGMAADCFYMARNSTNFPSSPEFLAGYSCASYVSVYAFGGNGRIATGGAFLDASTATYDSLSYPIRIPNNMKIVSVNGAGTGDVGMWWVNGSDHITCGALVTFPSGFTASAASSFSSTVAFSGDPTLGEGVNVHLGTTTGSQIGTVANAKLGFYGATPVVQPTSTTDLRQALINLGLYATGGATPLDLNGGTLAGLNVNLTGGLVAATVNTSGNSVFGTGAATSGKIGLPNASAIYGRNVANNADIAMLQLNASNRLHFLTTMEFADGAYVVLGTSTGTALGTSTSQKLSFWNKTPIVQPTTGITGATLVGHGGTTITSTDTFGGYTLAQLAAIIINTGLAA